MKNFHDFLPFFVVHLVKKTQENTNGGFIVGFHDKPMDGLFRIPNEPFAVHGPLFQIFQRRNRFFHLGVIPGKLLYCYLLNIISMKNMPVCKAPGTLENIGGKWWCIGEKITSKWKHSKLNKSKKSPAKKRKNKTAKKYQK
jgi:hypothetical protein